MPKGPKGYTFLPQQTNDLMESAPQSKKTSSATLLNAFTIAKVLQPEDSHGAFSHPSLIAAKNHKPNENFFIKPANDPKVAYIEVVGQEIFRMFMPWHP